MGSLRLPAVVSVLAHALCALGISAQARVVQECATPCSLHISLIATLGDTLGSEAGFVGQPQALARTRSGEFLLADRYDQDRLKRFSRPGEYIGHVGRRGKGPGEFEVLQFVTMLPGDSIETYDLGQRRITVFAPDWKVVRTIDIATGALEMVRLRNGSRVIAGYRYEPDRVGLPLHLIDAQGRMALSFGAQPPVTDLRNLHVFYRHVTRGPSDESVWSSYVLQYRLEEWSTEGRLVNVLERRPAWFEAGERYGYINAGQAPSAGIAALHLDADGVLWVVAHVPDANWREGLGETEDPYGRTYMGIAHYDSYFDTIIEAIDPVGGRLLGTRRMDDYAIGFTDDGLLFGYREARNGEPYIPVWAIRRPGDM